MKIIEIPATLRVFVDDSTTTEEAEKIADGLVSNTQGTVTEGVLEDSLKDHLEFMEIKSGVVVESDLWVYEAKEPLKIHQI